MEKERLAGSTAFCKGAMINMPQAISQSESHFELVLIPRLCKGCALCVKSCPINILYLDEREKIAVDLEDAEKKCIFCGLCQMRCPDFAIWVLKPSKTNFQAVRS
jgi:2-oxoglutarate ferredoxin oxidoreductase subunit delta